MSTNDEIEDAITRHQIFVQRYAKGREEAYQLYIEDLLEQTRARLTFDLTPESRVRTERLMLDLKALAEQLTGELTEETMDEMRRFMTQEAQFNYEILDTRVVADLSLPNANQIEAALSTNIMQLEPTKGYTIRSALAEFGSRKAQQIVQVIRDGTVLGETTQAIIQGIMDLGSVQKRQAATLARTITNHVATQARDLTMGDNRDILEGYKWVATLDGRTSLICASRDGKIFPIADDSPKPPAHFNCRSTISFAVKPEFDLGADLPGTRSSIDGPVDRNLTFGDWLRRQSPEFQDQVLGRERAKLFREQNIPIDRFVDDQGRVLSLDQLRRMDEDFNGLAPIQVPEPTAPVPLAAPLLKLDGIVDPKASIKQAAYEKAFNENSSDLAKAVAGVLEKPDLITSRLPGGKAFYAPASRRLQQKKIQHWKEVFTHEYGHHIDYAISRKELGFDSGNAWSETSMEFIEAFTQDRQALGLIDDREAAMDRMLDLMFDRQAIVSKYNSDTVLGYKNVPKTPLDTMFSDIIDAMTEGQFQRTRYTWGHGPTYYKRPGAQQKETFANLFAIQGTEEAREKARELFPNLMRVFEAKLRSVAEENQ